MARTEAQTPAPKKDQIKGSKTNPKGSASGSRGGIEIGDSAVKALENIIRKAKVEALQTFWDKYLKMETFTTNQYTFFQETNRMIEHELTLLGADPTGTTPEDQEVQGRKALIEMEQEDN